MDIEKVMVIGCGQMGHGIAQVCATGGADVYMYDISEEAIQKGIDAIKKSVAKFAAKGKITQEEADAVEGRLIATTRYEDATDADLVIEAVIEDLELKRSIFEELDAVMPENVILSSCTSALPITNIMSKTQKTHRTLGTHFHHPPVLMKLVEVAKGYKTDDTIVEAVIEFLNKVGKIPVPCLDSPGFVTSRIGIIMVREGIRCLAEGVSTAEDIDKACIAGYNWPMGPLKLADLIGLDTCLYVLDDLATRLGPEFLPPPILRQMVAAGDLGLKTGKGFFDYTS